MRFLPAIELAVAFILSLFLLKMFFSEKVVFEDLALGEETTRFLAKDSANRPMHIVEMNGEEQALLKTWSESGKDSVVLVLGNSQTHSINQIKPKDEIYVSSLGKHYESRGYKVFCHSIPNASLQEFLVMFEYWKHQLPVKLLLLPVFMDDLREDGLRDVFFNGLIAKQFRIGDSTAPIAKKLNGELSKFHASTASGETATDEDMKALHETVQENVERKMNDWLDAHFFAWAYRPTVRGELFNGLYNFRNTLFGIDASTKRKMIPARMETNLRALEQILASASSSGVKAIVYIPPIRHDVPLPYDENEYISFKEAVRSRVGAQHAAFADLDTLVPGQYWGMKNSTNASGKKELDYMHFQYAGHKLLSDALVPLIDSQLKQ
jgi:hypothetical protein